MKIKNIFLTKGKKYGLPSKNSKIRIPLMYSKASQKITEKSISTTSSMATPMEIKYCLTTPRVFTT